MPINKKCKREYIIKEILRINQTQVERVHKNIEQNMAKILAKLPL